MPIRGITEATRIARAGKIRMGVRKPNSSGTGDHPKSVDHFVCPPLVLEYLARDKVRYCDGACGEEPGPIELPIMFPVDDVERIASQSYRAYKRAGLVCRGDGYTARGRLVPAAEGITRDQHPKSVDAWAADGGWYDFRCLGEGYDGEPACPLFAVPNGCRKMMILQFLLLDVPGLDVWQLDTGSVNSMLNINSTINTLTAIRGGVAGVPMMLRAEPYEVNVKGKRTQITALRLSYDVTPREVLALPRVQRDAPAQLEAPDDTTSDEGDNIIDGEARLVEDPTPVAHQLEDERRRDCAEVVELITEAWQAWQGDSIGERQKLIDSMKRRWPQFMSPAGNLMAGRLTGPVAKDVLTYLKAAVRGEAADPATVGAASDGPPVTAATEPATDEYDAPPERPLVEGPPRAAIGDAHQRWCQRETHEGPCTRRHAGNCVGPDGHTGPCPFDEERR